MHAKVRHRILDIIMNKFSEKTFSVCIMNNINGFVQTSLKKGVSFYYLAPENLSRHYSADAQDRPLMSTGAVMAVFDEISTYSTSMKDRRMRPGQSVHLSTEVMKPIYAGDTVSVLTRADKLGRSIGYCTMEMLNSNGELVARGKHIRFLQMGLHFDFITHPLLLPWAVRAYELVFARKKSSRFSAVGKDIFPLPSGFPSIDGVGRVFDVLGLQRVAVPAWVAGTDGEGEEGPGPDSTQFCSAHGRVPAGALRAYKMVAKHITSNLLGNMHGGAVACAVEHACVLARAEQGPDGGAAGEQGRFALDCYVDSVEVRYISAMKGELLITVAEDTHSAPLPVDALGASRWRDETGNTDSGSMNSGGGGGCGADSGIGRSPGSASETSGARPVSGGHRLSRSFGKVLSVEDRSLCAEFVCTWAPLR